MKIKDDIVKTSLNWGILCTSSNLSGLRALQASQYLRVELLESVHTRQVHLSSLTSCISQKYYAESLEFGQLETATSLYICRMCVVLIIVYASLYIESFARNCTSINVHAALLPIMKYIQLIISYIIYVMCGVVSTKSTRARICKTLRSLGIYSKELIPPAYVAWRPGTTNPIPTRFLAPIDCSKIPALHASRSSCLVCSV
jgi:hypothetical protein